MGLAQWLRLLSRGLLPGTPRTPVQTERGLTDVRRHSLHLMAGGGAVEIQTVDVLMAVVDVPYTVAYLSEADGFSGESLTYEGVTALQFDAAVVLDFADLKLHAVLD